jgi:hypothetical protein
MFKLSSRAEHLIGKRPAPWSVVGARVALYGLVRSS